VAVTLRVLIAAAVIAGVGRRVWLERAKLATYNVRPAPMWLAASGVLYLAGLSTCAGFWWLAMRDRGARPIWATTFAAYLAGHLGKYVPGKGLVVVIRAGMMRDSGVGVANAAITCAHETVLMMAVGALVSLAILAVVDVPHRGYLLLCAGVLTVGLGFFASPPIAIRLGRLASRPFGAATETEMHASRWSTVAGGAAIISAGWLLMGISVAAVLAAVDELSAVVSRFGAAGTVALLTAVVALATVVGFVSLLPGGLVSREWVLVEVLAPLLGADGVAAATAAAVLLRVVWIVAEAVGTGLCWMLDRLCKRRRAESN
jgi:uncharacterized membrane protein YbhN (UPF0104 family)